MNSGGVSFLRQNARWLAAAVLLAFSSGYGQTFFISVFAGEIMAEFGLTSGQWGAIYSLGTLVSAGVMLWAGGLSDHFRARILGSGALFLLALSCLLMAFVSSVWVLPFAIFALRFSGQGMLSHVSMTSVARWFSAARGKALAVTSFGFSLSQAVLPLVFVSLLTLTNWRNLWLLAALLALVAIPVVWLLLLRERTPQSVAASSETHGLLGRHWTRRQALSHGLFWMLLPAFIGPSTFVTALFFQQVHLTEIKGWGHGQFVALFPLFTLVAVAATMVSGWAVDRFGAARLLPWAQLPMAGAFLVFAAGDNLLMAALGFVLLGLSNGGNAVLASAIWPEFYGTRFLGSIKAMATAVMVLGSAVGPVLSGVLIDSGVDFERQMVGFAIYTVLTAVLTLWAVSRLGRIIAGV